MCEREARIWRYGDYVPGALRLISVEDLLDCTCPTIRLVEWRGLTLPNQRTGTLIFPYRSRPRLERPDTPIFTAISHVWQSSEAVKKITEEVNRPLEIEVREATHTISWHGLVQAARAARHLHCIYLWLDLLCLNQRCPEDKRLQIMNMGRIYRNAAAVLVMFGGVPAAQSVDEASTWLYRAWTLQEALSCDLTFGLVQWRYPSAMFNLKHTVAFIKVHEDLAIISLRDLVSIEPQRPLGKGSLGFMGSITVDLSVKCLGDNRSALQAMWDAMSHTSSTPYAGTEGVWRSMWMRTSTRPQDLVFSSMSLLGVDIEVDYDRNLSDLILELVAKCPYAPGWLTMGYSIPVNPRSGLLPMLPHWAPQSLPVYHNGSTALPTFHFIDGGIGDRVYVDFDIVIRQAPILGGHIVCAQIFEIIGKRKLAESVDRGLSIRYELKLATSTHRLRATCCLKSGQIGSLLVGIGSTTRRLEGESWTLFDRKSLVFFIGKIGRVYQRVGVGILDLPEEFRNVERRNHIRVGGQPGSRLRECTCRGLDSTESRNVPCKLPAFRSWVKQGDFQ